MTYKRKNIILLSVFVLFLYVSWEVAIKETFIVTDNLSKVEEELKKIENAPIEISRLEGQLGQFKSKSQKLYSGVLEMRKGLLSEVSALANKYDLSLKSFPDYYLQQKEGIELTTSLLVLSGEFNNMVKLISDFEQTNKAGKISSTLFEVEQSPRSKKRELYLTLYVQSINL